MISIIIESLILVLTVLLASAAIYSAEEGKFSINGLSEVNGINNHESSEMNAIIGSASPVHGANHVNMPIVYV